MGLVLLVLLLLTCLWGLPRWSHSRDWGYRPSGSVGVALAVVLILVCCGQIPRGF